MGSITTGITMGSSVASAVTSHESFARTAASAPEVMSYEEGMMSHGQLHSWLRARSDSGPYYLLVQYLAVQQRMSMLRSF